MVGEHGDLRLLGLEQLTQVTSYVAGGQDDRRSHIRDCAFHGANDIVRKLRWESQVTTGLLDSFAKSLFDHGIKEEDPDASVRVAVLESDLPVQGSANLLGE